METVAGLPASGASCTGVKNGPAASGSTPGVCAPAGADRVLAHNPHNYLTYDHECLPMPCAKHRQRYIANNTIISYVSACSQFPVIFQIFDLLCKLRAG